MKHILHTFRSEERLGELRLGLEEPPPPPQQSEGGETRELPSSDAVDARGGGGGGGGGDEEREGPRDNGNGSRRAAEKEERRKGVGHESGRLPADRRREDTFAEAGGGSDGGGTGSQSHTPPQASMWRSRWVYRDKRSPAMEPDELQVEVRVSLDVFTLEPVLKLLPGLKKVGEKCFRCSVCKLNNCSRWSGSRSRTWQRVV